MRGIAPRLAEHRQALLRRNAVGGRKTDTGSTLAVQEWGRLMRGFGLTGAMDPVPQWANIPCFAASSGVCQAPTRPPSKRLSLKPTPARVPNLARNCRAARRNECILPATKPISKRSAFRPISAFWRTEIASQKRTSARAGAPTVGADPIVTPRPRCPSLNSSKLLTATS